MQTIEIYFAFNDDIFWIAIDIILVKFKLDICSTLDELEDPKEYCCNNLYISYEFIICSVRRKKITPLHLLLYSINPIMKLISYKKPP